MSTSKLFNTPNKLSLLRILLAPIILLFMLPIHGIPGFEGWNAFVTGRGVIVAAALFAVAGYTDYLDGHIARKKNQISVFGQFIDPIGDKLLVLAVFIAWVELGRISSFVPVVVLLREFLVTGLRLQAMERGRVIAAGPLGKAKTVSQFVAIGFLYLECGLFRFTQLNRLTVAGTYLANVAVVVSVLLTIISGLDYLRKNREVFS